MSDYGERLKALRKAKYPDFSEDMDMHDITDSMSWMADRIEELEAKLAKANDHIEGLEELLWAAEKDASEAEAYAGELEAKLSESEALLAKAVKLIELAIELGRWELNPSFRDELIAFTAELTSSVAADNQVKGGKHD